MANISIDNVIGKITPPPGPTALYGDPVAGLGRLFGTILNIFMIFAGISALVYMLWGALNWIYSQGDKEKIGKAQNQIINALIGLLFIVVGFMLFSIITGNVLGIIKRTPDGWQFKIPTINGN